jgi:hypothetical protein
MVSETKPEEPTKIQNKQSDIEIEKSLAEKGEINEKDNIDGPQVGYIIIFTSWEAKTPF